MQLYYLGIRYAYHTIQICSNSNKILAVNQNLSDTLLLKAFIIVTVLWDLLGVNVKRLYGLEILSFYDKVRGQSWIRRFFGNVVSIVCAFCWWDSPADTKWINGEFFYLKKLS